MKYILILLALLCSVQNSHAKDDWKLVWADEFDYQGLPDSTKWTYDTRGNAYGWGNKELQWYNVANIRNTYVSDGTMKIVARKEKASGKDYSSGRIMTKGKGDWKYCKLEVRAKLPKGYGTWPAIWMLSTEGRYGNWPRSGEIDIMEHVGFDPDTIFSTTHTNKYNHVRRTQKKSRVYCPTATSDFHVYGLEWDENEYRTYLDGKLIFTYKNDREGWESWPYDQPFNLILNLAIGGSLGGKKGVDDKLFPHTFEIDYVRVYQKESQVFIDSLMKNMSIDEKIGQLNQVSTRSNIESLEKDVRKGLVGSVINIPTSEINRIQKIAIEESPSKIPILFGRDVIHGYKTIFPIPLGMAATFNPDLVEKSAEVAAREASSEGIRWTFAPMIDISRDARWGRIAESFGEDPYLTSSLGVAMIRGFQGVDMANNERVAACAKHFAGYGAAEGGRDYNSTNIPERLLRNTYLPPFEAAAKTGVATFMTSFNDNDGVPSTGNEFLLKKVLRGEWNSNAMVVSDWGSIKEMIAHGYAKDLKHAADIAITAGTDMDMMSHAYSKYLKELMNERPEIQNYIDEAVYRVLKLKYDLGLFKQAINTSTKEVVYSEDHLEYARKTAEESVVLLKNENKVLPLSSALKRIAIIGPMANAPHDQLGTWIFDGNKEYTITPLKALREAYGSQVEFVYVAGLSHSRSKDVSAFKNVIKAVKKSDAAIVFLGEESILSGEAHSLADINLVGAQRELLEIVKQTGKPVITVVMAGRPLTIEKELNNSDALLYAWHPGTMGGYAIADILFGKVNPSGKLPVTFPRHVGQIPIYYNHNNTGRPAPNKLTLLDDIPLEAPQSSLGNTSFYLDYGKNALFPFGYGLSYSKFEYSNLNLSKKQINLGETFSVKVTLKNNSDIGGTEVVQLYVQVKVGSIVRPVKELKGFQRVTLKAGESRIVEFNFSADDLAFYGADMIRKAEPGDFNLWVGGSSEAELKDHFSIE